MGPAVYIKTYIYSTISTTKYLALFTMVPRSKRNTELQETPLEGRTTAAVLVESKGIKRSAAVLLPQSRITKGQSFFFQGSRQHSHVPLQSVYGRTRIH